jgi:hypothetical protein
VVTVLGEGEALVVQTSGALPLAGRGRLLRRIALTAAVGTVTFGLTNLTNQPLPWTLTLSVLIGGMTLLAQFLVDVEHRQESVEYRLEVLDRSSTAVAQQVKETVRREVSRFHENGQLLDRLAVSPLQADTLLRLLQLSVDVPQHSPGLARELSQAQIDTAVSFLEQLSHGEVSYDGEDRDWLLTLTSHARHTISATSATRSVNGLGIVDGGLWSSELGHRYLDAQREAVRRGVVIRRIFVLERGLLADDARVRKICDQQRSAGITVRILDASAMTLARVLLLPDLAIFDNEICYELTTGPRLGAAETPFFIKTLLVVRLQAV